MQVLIVLDITSPTSSVYAWREGLEMQLVHVVLVVLRRDQDRAQSSIERFEVKTTGKNEGSIFVQAKTYTRTV